MKADHALAELFAEDPDLIKVLVNRDDDTHYTMDTRVIKQVEKRLDACFLPDRPERPVIVTEFQGYDDRRIYYRAFAGAALLGEQ
jgi:predicted transposase YdaD